MKDSESPAAYEGMITSDLSLVNKRGQKLAVKLFIPKGKKIRAVISIHHGLGDYTGRHTEENAVFCEQGFAVCTFDAHGHGDSEPAKRCAIYKFDHLVDDAEQFISEVVGPFRTSQCPDAPLFLLGPSMGALVSFYVAARGAAAPKDVAGLIVSAAAMNAKRNATMAVLQPFSVVLNTFIPDSALVPALDPSLMCHDPSVLADIEADDKMWKGNVRVCTACSMLQGFDGVKALYPGLTMPIIAIHGADDPVCPIDFVKDMLDSIPSEDKTFIKIPDAKHDLQHDYCKDVWRKHVMTWINDRL